MESKNYFESLNTADVELFLFGVIALWGDSKITAKEMVFLVEKYKENSRSLEFFSYAVPTDPVLCCKEYFVGLFDLLKAMESNVDMYSSIQLPEKSIKKVRKIVGNYTPTTKHIVLFLLLEVIDKFYERDYLNYSKMNSEEKRNFVKVVKKESRKKFLISEMKRLAKIDGLDSGEIQLLDLVSLQNGSILRKWVWMATIAFLLSVFYLLQQ